MARKDIELRITNIFRDTFEDSEIELSYSTNADDIEEWDSLMQIMLLINIEKEFKIRFNPLEIVNLENIGQMIDLMEKMLKHNE